MPMAWEKAEGTRPKGQAFSGQVAARLPCGATSGNLAGQVAMEYLVTYGWAFLALFAVLAILFASGFFSSSSFSTPECVFQPDLPCNSFILYSTGSSSSNLGFTLSNGLGYKIKVTRMNYTTSDLGAYGKNSTSVPVSLEIESGAQKSFLQQFSGPAQPEAGAVRTTYVGIEYLACKRDPCTGPYASSGRITAVQQPSSSPTP